MIIITVFKQREAKVVWRYLTATLHSIVFYVTYFYHVAIGQYRSRVYGKPVAIYQLDNLTQHDPYL